MHHTRIVIWAALCCFVASAGTFKSIVENNWEKRRCRRNKDPSRADGADPLPEKDGLALSREIFRNITKHLRESIASKDLTLTKSTHQNEKAEHLFRNKIDSYHHHVSHQAQHHHEHHWGPYFEDDSDSDGIIEVSGYSGSEALINCRVGMLKDKTVMWLRRAEDVVRLLTVGRTPYSSDSRIAVKFQYPNNWKLSINPVNRDDAGLYMCQISTHPPRAIVANLTILAPILTITDEQNHEVKDRFYKAGSSIELTCLISESYAANLPARVNSKPPARNSPLRLLQNDMLTSTRSMNTEADRRAIVSTTDSPTVAMLELFNQTSESNEIDAKARNESIEEILTTVETTTVTVLNNVYGLIWTKNGTHLSSEKTSFTNLSSTILISVATQSDSGSYSCSFANHTPVSVYVNVLTGENQAAVHHDTWSEATQATPKTRSWISVILTITYLISKY